MELGWAGVPVDEVAKLTVFKGQVLFSQLFCGLCCQPSCPNRQVVLASEFFFFLRVLLAQIKEDEILQFHCYFNKKAPDDGTSESDYQLSVVSTGHRGVTAKEM